ncbi:MAG: PASTA domain-containing protein [Spirochaetes bacterium]|nr:PASTA domain-containing protein [Spirochaetota bacterium]
MDQKVYKRRLVITGLFILSIACFFIYRLVNLHFSDKIKLSASVSSDKRRGYIKDRNGHILAVSILKNSLFANPQEIENPSGTAAKLSPLVHLSTDYILTRLNRDKRFVWIRRKIDDDIAEKIEKLKIRGLYFRKEYQRAYPNGKLASNILGFTGIDNTGLEGIEYKYNNILMHSESESIFSGRRKRYADNIVLTIDKYIQHICETEIERAVLQNKASRGVAVALEVKTGKILAIGKYPDFNPNYYYNYSSEQRSHFSVVNSFEPGSTLKIISLAAILEKNPAALRKTYRCTGSIQIGDATVKCGKVHGIVNLHDIIRESCNVGIMLAVKDISKADFFSVLGDFGFGERTGIELPAESPGILRPVSEWSGLSKYSISIGQEISVTSLQIVAAIGAIANDGVYLYPTIIERIEKNDGTVLQEYSPKAKGRLLSRDESGLILRIMRSAVTDGTGKMADMEYYRPAGKTGTAQKFSKAGYYEKHVASFVGVAPYANPDLCVFVALDEPKVSISGGEIAAPVFSEITRKALVYRGIKLKNVPGIQPKSFKSKELQFKGSSMPDFSGMPVSRSLQLLIKIQRDYNVKYHFEGKGNVYKQEPAPGTDLKEIREIVLYLRDD